jgi:hypothetical protein
MTLADLSDVSPAAATADGSYFQVVPIFHRLLEATLLPYVQCQLAASRLMNHHHDQQQQHTAART